MLSNMCSLILFFICTGGILGVNGYEVKSVSVMEGDSVTLHTNVTKIKRRDQILWMFGPQETRIAEIYKKSIDMYNSNETFGDRLNLDNQTGSLTITNISITNSGLYKLQIFSNKETLYKRFNVTVYAHLPIPVISSQSSSSLSSSSKCVVLCSVLNVTDVSLSWYKGNSLLSSINVSDLNIRLSLSLEIEYQDTNTYRCVLNNTITNQTQHLNISDICLDSVPLYSYWKRVMPSLVYALVGVASVALLVFYVRSEQKAKAKISL
ncbi:uncharacterized protein [Misgurnus anguillicaudatus]|uniref:uncharacterized protein n=1 Tax=Misgurnus anguillicaudatus TaxID=75329 RepID=UPI003CCF8E0E